MSLDLTRPTRLHLVGIGGAGMSAIATVLAQMGHAVSGSDLKASATVERLRGLGVTVAIGHDAANVAGAEHVGISSAVSSSNVELLEAHRRGVPVHARAELLAAICATRRTLAVAGTHGKTTTSSMLALVLLEAGLSPSFIIGGEVNEIGTNAAFVEGEWLVVEADESDGTFLQLPAEVAVVTSVEPDHLEHFGSFAALTEGFAEFLRKAAGAVVCADDAGARALAPEGAVTYGFSEGADYRVSDFTTGRAEIAFGLIGPEGDLGRFTLPVPGAHNARNAAAALAAARLLGADPDAARRALARFAGVARRFQFRGEAGGVTFVDDYAHLPGEVAATLAAARGGGWERLVCVFQPHRYSRTESVGGDFGEAFVDADVVVITGIYGAGEAPRPGVSAKLVLDAVLNAHPETTAAYFPDRRELVGYLARLLRPGDCCLTLSAGDLTSLPDELLEVVTG
ncbi:MAG TPA: UDP-N-acetylmuramate--L-alanine ligase [Acidimicrobiales bacterium]|nr:UDP-N-acetylmuramate--L-alanine ligase [Acidimicrobiales bacterium]